MCMWEKPTRESILHEAAAVVEGGKVGKMRSTTQPPTNYTLPYGVWYCVEKLAGIKI